MKQAGHRITFFPFPSAIFGPTLYRMALPKLPLVVLDTETTGFVPRVHKIMEYAAMRFDDGKQVDEYEGLFAAEDIPPHVQVLTRIRPQDLSGKPKIEDAAQEILSRIPEDAVLVGQNLGFDLGMLKGHGMDLSERPWIDTSLLASLVYPELESYSLGYLSKVLKLNHAPQHRALGDVRATKELLEKVCERLEELPVDLREGADAVMAKAPEGYRRLFAALGPAKGKKRPSWLVIPEPEGGGVTQPVDLPEASAGQVTLMEESLDADFVGRVIEGAKTSKNRHWIAVKNLDALLRRSSSVHDAKHVSVIRAPFQLLDPEAAKALLAQTSFTAEEALLALKLQWFTAKSRSDLPVHGGEEAVWSGKLAATASAKAYRAQFEKLANVVVIDHRELLAIVTDAEHPGHKELMAKNTQVIVDDASMLEDTATKAYGWTCEAEVLRAAASGNPLLTQLADLLQLWMERTRNFQDVRYLTISDVNGQDAKGLCARIDDVLSQGTTPQVLKALADAKKILDPKNLDHRITWIEQWQNGALVLSSVPEKLGLLLQEDLFAKTATTLLIPRGSANFLPELLPPGGGAKAPLVQVKENSAVPVSLDTRMTPESVLDAPPQGKTVLLVPGKSMAEALYVKYAERLEEQNVTLICQGMSGGQGRMQAEFSAAEGQAIWILTPFSFEGMDLPVGTVDQLIIKALPFDHPSHTVLSRRAQHYRNAFEEYLLPRLMHRLFRVMRTFCRFRTANGSVFILDPRIDLKEYGKTIMAYVNLFTSHVGVATSPDTKAAAPSAPKKKVVRTAKPKGADSQLSLL